MFLALASSCLAADPAAQIGRIMEARARQGQFSGAVLVAERGQVIYQHAFGFANLEWRIPNDIATKFEIGSMTKQFTALLVLRLVNEGRLRLDGPLSTYLPYYRKDTGDRVTIHHLLSHTSGIPNFLAIPGFLDGPDSRTKYRPEDFARRFCSGDLHFDPGSKFEYSNSNYFLLGAVLERVTGTTYEQLLGERIFSPLGMKDSGYTHTDEVIPRRASGYERTHDGLRNARFYDMSIPFAAGALFSTVGDLALWDRALYTEKLLPAPLRDLLFKPNLESYGYGWAILVPKPGLPFAGEPIDMHGGAIFGFQSLIERIPSQQDLIVLLDNTESPKLLDIALDIRGALARGQ